ncbi:MAG: hypothetical protein LBD98_03980 [Endomicrobium sp.]|nr:hypothetical protein [Endomicrobium sp.]
MHLTICFTALAIFRYIQDKTGISIKRFVQKLEPLRTAIVEISFKGYIAEPEIDNETQKLIKSLDL